MNIHRYYFQNKRRTINTKLNETYVVRSLHRERKKTVELMKNQKVRTINYVQNNDNSFSSFPSILPFNFFGNIIQINAKNELANIIVIYWKFILLQMHLFELFLFFAIKIQYRHIFLDELIKLIKEKLDLKIINHLKWKYWTFRNKKKLDFDWTVN